MNLLSTVYSQSWPAPDPNKHTNKGFHGKHTCQSPRKNTYNISISHGHQLKYGRSESWHGKGISTSHQSPRDATQRMAFTPSRHIGLDEGTYKWKTWTNYKQDCEDNKNDLTMYKITQDTFRKLSDQVREVNQQISKYHNTGFKSFHTNGDINVPIIRPTQLAASLPYEPPSISRAPATDNMGSAMALQCRSVQRSNRRPHSHSVTSRQKHNLPQRPYFTTALNGRQSASEFDQLTPRIIGALCGGKQTDIDASQLGPFDIVANEAKPEIINDGFGDDNSNTDEGSDSPRHFRVRTPPDFDLPPEDMNIHDFRGRFQYRSSSTGKKKQEPYPEPLSEPYCYFDLLELSLLKEDWRNAVRTVPTGIEEKLINRLIEMERLQIASAEMERSQRSAPPKRAMSAMQIRKGWNSIASVPTERAHSALGRSRQSKNCTSGCLQPLCTGDCDTKQDSPSNGGCLHCKQEYCQGSCTEFGYHLHIRQPRQEEEKVPHARPNSCKSCTRRSSSKKSTINANTVILGRPKSAFATFSSAKQQVRKMQTISSVAASVSDKMAKLGLSSDPDAGGDHPPRPKTASGTIRSKPRGRNSMLPGKSFTSQRRHSLTDEPISTSAAKMNPKLIRIKSARLKTKQKKNAKR